MKEVINNNDNKTEILVCNALYTWEEVYDWLCVYLSKA